ncbi:hypothetical protein G9A89_006517 [Geosiphon pyriformis]|nr:hypothetical protein G9A89_006517 [Geosiphon pyriformis]
MSVASDVVDLSAGFLSLIDIGNASVKPVVPWKSKVGSVSSSVSGLLDVKNMENTVTKETSYAEFGKDNNMDKTTPKKTCTQTYVLGNLPKQSLFDHMSNNNIELVFLLSSAKLHVLKKCSFESVKSFALDVKLSAVFEKTNSNKLIAIKKIFYQIDGFRETSTSSKFLGIIRSSFTSELNLKKARELAICEKIVVNDNIRQIKKCMNQEVIVKEISVDLFKSAVKLVFSKFGKVVSVKLQLIGLWQKTLIKFKSADVASLALFYTFSIGITAHDLSDLLELYGGKTCFFGHNLSSYVCNRCAVVCFENKTSRLAAFDSVSVFKGVNLHWAGLFLAHCVKYKQFGYIFDLVTDWDWVCLAGIYKKKQALIVHSVFVVFLVASGAKSSPDANSIPLTSNSFVVSDLNDYLASLKRFLGLLADQVSSILRKLSFVNLVLLASFTLASLFVVFASLAMGVGSDMVLDSVLVSSVSLLPAVSNSVLSLSSNSSKILTNKVGGLKSKLTSLETSIGSVLARLDYLCSGLGSPLPSLF